MSRLKRAAKQVAALGVLAFGADRVFEITDNSEGDKTVIVDIDGMQNDWNHLLAWIQDTRNGVVSEVTSPQNHREVSRAASRLWNGATELSSDAYESIIKTLAEAKELGLSFFEGTESDGVPKEVKAEKPKNAHKLR